MAGRGRLCRPGTKSTPGTVVVIGTESDCTPATTTLGCSEMPESHEGWNLLLHLNAISRVIWSDSPCRML